MTKRDKIAYGLAGMVVLGGLALVALAHLTLPSRATNAGPTPDALVAGVAATSGRQTPAPDYAVISKRPIFLASRRMPPPAPEPVAATAPTTAPLPSLVGIMIEADKKTAVVKRVNDAKVLSLTEGQSIDGWLLKDVKNSKITLQSGSNQQTLALPEIGK